MDPIRLLRQGKYFLDRANRGFQEGGAAEGEFRITALMCSNSGHTWKLG